MYKRQRKAFLFDADGTIINSSEDLHDAANYVLRTFGFPEHDTDAYRYFVGNGARKLIARAFPAGTPAQILDKAYALYSAYYPEPSIDQTAPYPGVVEALTQLKAEGYRLAVISNKPDNQTQLKMCIRDSLYPRPDRFYHRQKQG